MTTYVVTEKTTGEEVYRYQADAPVEWNGMEFATHDHAPLVEIAPDGVIEGVVTSKRISKLQFVGLLGADFTPILAAAKQSVEVEAFVKMLDWATPDADGTSVDLKDARVVDALNRLEAVGLLATGRAGEILNG